MKKEDQGLLTFGDILRRIRLDAGWKQSEVASRWGRHEAPVSRIEKNETLPKRATVIAYLGVGLELPDDEQAHYLKIYDEMANGFQQKPAKIQRCVRSEPYLACLKRAETVALDCGSALVGTPHLFLAVYQSDILQVRYFFRTTGIDLHHTAVKVRKVFHRKAEGVIRHIGDTLGAIQVKEMAEKKAEQEQTAVSYKHLWFALLAQEDSFLGQILELSGHQAETLIYFL
ncbi:MAG: helix-turn-helix transcriptional regulator [Chloroflexota bacterium]